jgi:hypothetical protein
MGKKVFSFILISNVLWNFQSYAHASHVSQIQNTKTNHHPIRQNHHHSVGQAIMNSKEETENSPGKLIVGSMFGSAMFSDGHHAPVQVIEGTLAYLFHNHIEVGSEFGMAGNYPLFGIDINYHFPIHAFIGIQGMMKYNGSPRPYVGAKVGYDFHINRHFVIGPEFQVNNPLQGNTHLFEGFAAFKYYF